MNLKQINEAHMGGLERRKGNKEMMHLCYDIKVEK